MRRDLFRLVRLMLAGAPLLLAAPAGEAATIYQVKDLGPTGSALKDFYFMADVDGRLIFLADDGSDTIHTGQPYISDGTSTGTQLISPIGSAGGGGFNGSAIVSGGNLYFTFDNDGTGSALWKTDGTALGTHQLSGKVAGNCIIGGPARPDGVFFIAPTGATCPDYNHVRLWTTDGSGAGTIVAEPSIVAAGAPFAAADQTAFFIAEPAVTFDLYRSTGSGTDLTYLLSSGPVYPPTLEAAVNERMFFTFDDGVAGDELWSATTLDTSATLTRDIISGGAGSDPKNLYRVDDRLFFSADDGTTGRELWVSDSTSAGTIRVLDINPGPPASSPFPLGAIDGVLLFMADDGTHGRELWRSDGTPAGTYLVKDTLPGFSSGLPTAPPAIVANRHLFFPAFDGGNVARLWISDGTANGTHLVASPGPAIEAVSGLEDVAPATFAASNGHLFMKADSGSGVELHALDLIQSLGTQSCKNGDQPLADGGTVQSVMRLPTGTGKKISSVDVRFDAGHTFAGDLVVSLTHADTGKTATLLSQPGDGRCTGALIDIDFDDDAGSSADANCSASRPAYPRDRRYQPTSPLKVFAGDDIGGRWVLTIEYTATRDSGTLHEWCLTFNDGVFGSGFE